MISTKRLRDNANEPRQVQPKRDMNRPHKSFAGWVKKCGAFVGFLATLVALIAGVAGIIMQMPGKPSSKVMADTRFKIVKVDGEQFEFQVALTLINAGEKPDTIGRPYAEFKSAKPVIECSRDIDFTNNQGGDVPFPLILQKGSPVQLTGVIKWRPSEDYYKAASAEAAGSQKNLSMSQARIELTWPGENPICVAVPFTLVDVETIRRLKPGEKRVVNYMPLDSDPPDVKDGAVSGSAPSALLFESQAPQYRAVSIETGGAARIASIGLATSPAQAAKIHYAEQGEIASGKEVPSANPKEVTVNIRPCGGAVELVVFRAQFKKRLLGSLPCGVQIVQVEKL